jgi:cation diffusion facilitator family transporter
MSHHTTAHAEAWAPAKPAELDLSQDEAHRQKAMRAIVVSSLGLLVTSGLELLAVFFSGSVALLSDALHNLGDVFTTVGVYVGFRFSRRRPTAKFPYGYGRAEDVAGLVVVAAIWASAGLAAVESYDKLVSARGTSHLGVGMIAAVIGVVGNQWVARYKLKVGREIKSAPLIVDARHSWLDAVSSAGALLGLVGVAGGFRQADPIAGFAISLFIVRIGLEATRDVVVRLMDAQDEELADAARAAAREVVGPGGVGDVRVRWLGRQVEVRLVVRLPGNLALADVGRTTRTLTATVQHRVPDVREVFVTIDADTQ